MAKGCDECRYGSWESDGDYNYFICEKREDDGNNKLQQNLGNPTYRERYKRCFEPMIEAICKTCKETELVTFDASDNYQCPCCWMLDKQGGK